jgi:hypothetical protein
MSEASERRARAVQKNASLASGAELDARETSRALHISLALAFIALAAVGVFTVVLPELRSDPNTERQGANATDATQESDAPAAQQPPRAAP